MRKKHLIIMAMALAIAVCMLVACSTSPQSGTSSPALSDDNYSFETDPLPTESSISWSGETGGLVYYNSKILGLDFSSMTARLDDLSAALFTLYLQSTHYVVKDIDKDNLTALVLLTVPDLEAEVNELFSTMSSSGALTSWGFVSAVKEQLASLISFSNFKRIPDATLPITVENGGYVIPKDSGLSDLLFDTFIEVYETCLSEEYVIELMNESGILFSSVEAIRSDATILDSYVPTEDNIIIAQSSLETCKDRTIGEYTNPFLIDMDNDSEDELIFVSAQTGLVILKENGDQYSFMFDEWLDSFTEQTDEYPCTFNSLEPLELTIIDSDIDDGRIEIILKMSSVFHNDGEYGKYYIFGFDPSLGLTGKELIEYGPLSMFTSIGVRGNHLCLETLVNIMGFRYMQINAHITEDLELSLYSNGNLFFRYTIFWQSSISETQYKQSKAVLAVPLTCNRVTSEGTPGESVTLPVGTELIPVRASRVLNPDGGGLAYASPVGSGERSETIPSLRVGEIVFQDNKYNLYIVRAEITSFPAVDLANVYYSDWNDTEQIKSGTLFYPESIYIGGIEQNVLFENIDYSAYAQYFGLMSR